MIGGFYYPGDSAIHRAPAGLKLCTLIVLCGMVFLIESLVFTVLIGVSILGAFALARIPAQHVFFSIRPVLIFLVILFVLEWLLIDAQTATRVIVRFLTLILAATLVTQSTRSSAMLDALESGLRPLARLGLDTARISLALSLAIRFAPLMAEVASEVREAQRARGLDRSVFALAVPTVIRTLKTADAVADAIDARGFGGRRA